MKKWTGPYSPKKIEFENDFVVILGTVVKNRHKLIYKLSWGIYGSNKLKSNIFSRLMKFSNFGENIIASQ